MKKFMKQFEGLRLTERGDTMFADMYAAYEALPDNVKHAMAGRRARYSRIDLDDADVFGGRQHDWTLGANWYLTSHFKFQANYVKVDASRRGVRSQPEIFELRAQMHF